MAHSLRLIEDRLPAGAGYPAPLPGVNRVLYAASGDCSLEADSGPPTLSSDEAWQGAGPCSARAGGAGVRVLRFELVRQPPPAAVAGRVVLEHPIALDARERYLMRCDRVDFEPGGVALPHRHRGGGIRCLLSGRLEVTVGDPPGRLMYPGDAWFESGREPVLAVAAAEVPTSFVRVSILPAEIRGRSSIIYIDPADAGRGRPRKYTVYVDEPISL